MFIVNLYLYCIRNWTIILVQDTIQTIISLHCLYTAKTNINVYRGSTLICLLNYCNKDSSVINKQSLNIFCCVYYNNLCEKLNKIQKLCELQTRQQTFFFDTDIRMTFSDRSTNGWLKSILDRVHYSRNKFRFSPTTPIENYSLKHIA